MAEEKPVQKPPTPEGRDALEGRVRDLEAALAASKAAMPLSLIPEHGAGPGMEVNETWSQAEQEEAASTEATPTR